MTEVYYAPEFEAHFGSVTPLDRFHMSVRLRQALDWESISTVGQLRKYTDSEILRWPNVGLKVLREIRALLALAPKS